MQQPLQDTLNYVGLQTLQSLSLLLPKILGAFAAFVIGVMLAKLVKGVVQKLLKTLNFSNFINKTPLQFAFESKNLGQKLEHVIANIFYWLTMLVIIHTTVTILDLESLTQLLNVVISYIPNVISAMFILIFGVLLGGWVESLIKNTTKTVDQKSARFMGKVGGYVIVTLTTMTALSELGIADEFIRMLFMGFVATISLGAGLAIGLGGKNTVEKILGSWYESRAEMTGGKKPTKKKKK